MPTYLELKGYNQKTITIKNLNIMNAVITKTTTNEIPANQAVEKNPNPIPEIDCDLKELEKTLSLTRAIFNNFLERNKNKEFTLDEITKMTVISNRLISGRAKLKKPNPKHSKESITKTNSIKQIEVPNHTSSSESAALAKATSSTTSISANPKKSSASIPCHNYGNAYGYGYTSPNSLITSKLKFSKHSH